MASISCDQNGHPRIQFVAPGGSRPAIPLGVARELLDWGQKLHLRQCNGGGGVTNSRSEVLLNERMKMTSKRIVCAVSRIAKMGKLGITFRHWGLRKISKYRKIKELAAVLFVVGVPPV